MKHLHTTLTRNLPFIFSLCLMAILFIDSNQAQAQESAPAKLSGIVIDEAGNPMIGATVYVKGKTRGTATNEEGKFSLEVMPDEIIVFSYIGYDPQEYIVTPDLPESLKIQLELHVGLVAEPATSGLYDGSDNR